MYDFYLELPNDFCFLCKIECLPYVQCFESLVDYEELSQAYVDYSDLGRAVLDYQIANAAHYPEIQILHYCLMPDHLHAIWYVRKAMPRGISAAVRGFWQGVKKAGRAYSYLSYINPESDSGEKEES